jgi:hypothetical protein
MLKKCLAVMVMVGLMVSVALAAEEFPYAQEQVGKLHLGLTAKDVKRIIPGQPQRGKAEKWGADGAYHQEWQYPKEGVTLSMVSEKQGGPQSLERITLTSPSTLRTQRGIGIGSTEAEVNKAYGRFRNAEDSAQFNYFIAGSIFGGVMFKFDQGKVSWIFIGANAE